MNTLKEIARAFIESENVLLYPHVHADGDALGSTAALCAALRTLGKNAYILIEDEIAEDLAFISGDYPVMIEEGEDAASISERLFGGSPIDMCACVDCGDTSRFEKRKEIYVAGKVTACIDHHGTSKPFADYNYIDPAAAATAEIIYDLLREAEALTGKVLIDKKVGEAIYAGLSTDTGKFQYSNTTKKTHLIAADLLDMGIDFSTVAVNIYQNSSLSKIKLNSLAVDAMKIFADGKASITCVTRDMLEKAGADMNEAEGIVDTLRNIRGVEIAVFLKELDENVIKVSMRAKSYANVSEIAQRYGGGGHIKAAGCTLLMTPQEAEKIMMAEVSKAL